MVSKKGCYNPGNSTLLRMGGGGGHFNFVCTGVCGHSIRKLAYLQTKTGPSINKNRQFSDYLQQNVNQN